MEVTASLTEINTQIAYWQRSIRSITGSGGRIEQYTANEEANLKNYRKNLKKWEDLRNSMLE